MDDCQGSVQGRRRKERKGSERSGEAEEPAHEKKNRYRGVGMQTKEVTTVEKVETAPLTDSDANK